MRIASSVAVMYASSSLIRAWRLACLQAAGGNARSFLLLRWHPHQPGAEGDPCEDSTVLELSTLGQSLVRAVGMYADGSALAIKAPYCTQSILLVLDHC